ncbi:MAG: hypothetical protein M3R07_04685 [Gemmatimonadota bacterium]|nr:hypothetical protein [Gemmatimonadota bacterium]
MRITTNDTQALSRIVSHCKRLVHPLAVLAWIASLASVPLPAQTISQSGIAQRAQARVVRSDSVGNYVHPARVQVQRTVMALGGEIAGLVVGGMAGYALAGKCQRYNCDYHGLPHLLTGSLIGGVMGTAAGASAAEGYNNCTRGHRFKRAIAGATIGTVVSVAALSVGGPGVPVAALSPPIVAALALKRC